MTTPLAELGPPLLTGRFKTAKATTEWAAWPLGTELLCRMTINIPGSRPIVGRLVYPNMGALLKSMGLEVVQ